MTADFLDQKRNEIAARIGELRPLVAEYERLQAAADALDGIPRTSAASRPAAARSAGGAATGRRPGRPKGSGKRGEQALAVIMAHPGITVPELAAKMGIKQNYLYRVLPGLAETNRVRKEGRGWHPQSTD